MYIRDDPSGDHAESPTTCTNPQPIITEQSMKNAAAKWILKMREGHRIPQSVMESIVSGASSLFQLALSGLQQTLQSRLLDTQVSADTSSLVMDCLNCEHQYTRIFQGLETSYKQNSYICTHFPFVVRDLCMYAYIIIIIIVMHVYILLCTSRNRLMLFLAPGKNQSSQEKAKRYVRLRTASCMCPYSKHSSVY